MSDIDKKDKGILTTEKLKKIYMGKSDERTFDRRAVAALSTLLSISSLILGYAIYKVIQGVPPYNEVALLLCGLMVYQFNAKDRSGEVKPNIMLFVRKIDLPDKNLFTRICLYFLNSVLYGIAIECVLSIMGATSDGKWGLTATEGAENTWYQNLVGFLIIGALIAVVSLVIHIIIFELDIYKYKVRQKQIKLEEEAERKEIENYKNNNSIH